MQALVIYESMFGNTHAIAEAIAGGLRQTHSVTVHPIGDVESHVVDEADLVVVGGPTHAHGMSLPASRDAAAEVAEDPEKHLDLDAGPNEPGVRGWLLSLDRAAFDAAAFDTRLDAAPILTGRASKGIAKRLEKHGARLVADPESFLVDTDNVLRPGEIERAHEWGARLGARQAARSTT